MLIWPWNNWITCLMGNIQQNTEHIVVFSIYKPNIIIEMQI